MVNRTDKIPCSHGDGVPVEGDIQQTSKPSVGKEP